MFFEAAPNIEDLNLSGCENVKKLRPKSLLNLKKLNLSNSNIESVSVDMFFKAAPNIEDLNLFFCENVKKLQLKPNSLLSLTKLTCSLGNLKNLRGMNDASFDMFFKAAPNLREAEWFGCAIDDLQLNPKSLPNLKKLTLNTAMSMFSLEIFLKAASNIEDITVFGEIYCFGLNLTLTPKSLPNLKKLKLSGESIDFVSFKSILNAAHNIEDLNLSGYSNIKNLKLKPNSLLNLTKLTLPKVGIDLVSLKSILNAAPNLRTITLTLNGNLKNLKLDRTSLQHLTELHLSSLDLCSLANILCVTPKLVMLDVEKCQITKLNLNKIRLPWLENINLKSCFNTQEESALFIERFKKVTSNLFTVFSIGNATINHNILISTPSSRMSKFKPLLDSDTRYNNNSSINVVSGAIIPISKNARVYDQARERAYNIMPTTESGFKLVSLEGDLLEIELASIPFKICQPIPILCLNLID